MREEQDHEMLQAGIEPKSTTQTPPYQSTCINRWTFWGLVRALGIHLISCAASQFTCLYTMH